MALRKTFDLYANVRPAKTYPGVITRYDHIDLVIGQVTREHMAASLQKLSYMGALATRCCAYIYHIVALLWSSRLCDKH